MRFYHVYDQTFNNRFCGQILNNLKIHKWGLQFEYNVYLHQYLKVSHFINVYLKQKFYIYMHIINYKKRHIYLLG